MALQIQTLTRSFKHGSLALPDPDPKMTADQVKDFYATTLYTELTNAAIEGPETKGDKLVYEFRRAVGTKGADLRSRLHALAHVEAKSAPDDMPCDDTLEISAAIAACARVSTRRWPVDGKDRLLPSSENLAPLP